MRNDRPGSQACVSGRNRINAYHGRALPASNRPGPVQFVAVPGGDRREQPLALGHQTDFASSCGSLRSSACKSLARPRASGDAA
jgi:hypothetical protein